MHVRCARSPRYAIGTKDIVDKATEPGDKGQSSARSMPLLRAFVLSRKGGSPDAPLGFESSPAPDPTSNGDVGRREVMEESDAVSRANTVRGERGLVKVAPLLLKRPSIVRLFAASLRNADSFACLSPRKQLPSVIGSLTFLFRAVISRSGRA